MNENKLNKIVIKYWYISIIITILFFLTLNVVFFLFFKLVTALIFTLLNLALIAFLIYYPFVRYHNYSYLYDEEKIVIRSGVIFKNEILLPAIQIQDLHVVDGPVSRIFNLAKIIISTGGSNYVLGPLNSEEAKMLINEFHNNLITRVKLSLKVNDHEEI